MYNSTNACNMQYHLFISYSSNDKRMVHSVADKLSLKYKIWIDKMKIGEGNSLAEKIENGIRTSHIVACFISKNYCGSEICRKECALAYQKKKIVLPVMLERETEVDQNFFTGGIDLLTSSVLKITAYKIFKPIDRVLELRDFWVEELSEKLSQILFDKLFEICGSCVEDVINGLNPDLERRQITENSPCFMGQTSRTIITSENIFDGIFIYAFLSSI